MGGVLAVFQMPLDILIMGDVCFCLHLLGMAAMWRFVSRHAVNGPLVAIIWKDDSTPLGYHPCSCLLSYWLFFVYESVFSSRVVFVERLAI